MIKSSPKNLKRAWKDKKGEIMEIKTFDELEEKDVKFIADSNFNYWKNFNPALNYNDSTGAILAMKNNKTNLPVGLALVDDKEIIAFCTLRENRLLKYPQFNPWICNVMIFDKYQHQGYGRILLEKACEKIKEMGFKKVYVWTDQTPDFYHHLGYKFEQKVEKNEGGLADLFSKDLV